ncbi:MAG TPA: hypothetical protein VLB27_05060, partial [candidate division Zixibacteria bacterium]|nr:hypothetical protein [candidate division Zixibacteria bacterium]
IARVYTTFESLIRDCQQVSEDEVMPGDVYITLDTAAVDAGHLALVLDVAERLPDAAESVPGLDRQPAPRLFLFSNSLTPATNYHIVKPIKPNKGNWFVPGEMDMKLAGYPDGAYYRLPYAYLR